MRVGQNPAKFVNTVAQPAPITATVVSCIPFLSGFYEQNLEVLRECITSLYKTGENQYDIMVFDNHSCHEVRRYLVEAYEQGVIQTLVLSEKNIGKLGAWNFMFGAAQGKYIAFSDSDVYFRPGWLEASLKLFQSYPNVGMVTGRPIRSLEEYSTATVSWGRNMSAVTCTDGVLMEWDTYVEHTRSLGHPDEKARQEYSQGVDHLLEYGGQSAYAGAGHFQFVALKEVLNRIFPVPSEKPMRGETVLDEAVNQIGYLRLCTVNPHVLHMGNQVPDFIIPRGKAENPKPWFRRLVNIPFIRSILLRIYGVIFHIYFNHVD